MADSQQQQQGQQQNANRASTAAQQSGTGRQDQSAHTNEKSPAESINPKANVKLGSHKYAEQGKPVRFVRKKE
jgi:hypothetical protein